MFIITLNLPFVMELLVESHVCPHITQQSKSLFPPHIHSSFSEACRTPCARKKEPLPSASVSSSLTPARLPHTLSRHRKRHSIWSAVFYAPPSKWNETCVTDQRLILRSPLPWVYPVKIQKFPHLNGWRQTNSPAGQSTSPAPGPPPDAQQEIAPSLPGPSCT